MLLSLLDDDLNDIFIHFDKKQMPDEQKVREIKRTVSFSKIAIIDSIPIYWGHFSIVEAELRLLTAALSGSYAYYHLLSGMDLPLKNQNEIHHFFEENYGTEFVQFCWDQWQKENEKRYRYYWFFQEKIGNRHRTIWNVLNRLSLTIQKIIGVNRQSGYKSVVGGSQWFSIANGLARYICEQEKKIRERFRFTLIPDECFVQTIVAESDFMNHVYEYNGDKNIESSMRYIDWILGAPYTFREDDFPRIMNSGCLLARKFDEEVDVGIINRIQDALR